MLCTNRSSRSSKSGTASHVSPNRLQATTRPVCKSVARYRRP